MDDKINKNIKNIMDQLDTSQCIIEQNAFSVLNEQDKILALIKNSTDKLMEVYSYAEGITFMASELMDEKNKTKENNDNQVLFHEIDEFLDLLSQQQVLLQEFGSIFSGVIRYQEGINEIIHKLESDIANHRNGLEKLTIYNDKTSL